MDLIDKYLYTLSRNLPEKNRSEVESAVRDSIFDMLPDDYNDEDIKKVLMELGNPAELAEKYREKKRYVIGPHLFPGYIFVLKLVGMIILFAAPIISILQIVSGDTPETGNLLWKYIGNVFSFVFECLFQGFFWVTITFAGLEMGGVKWPYTGKDWTFADLKERPQEKQQIHISEPIAEIFFQILFAVLICFLPRIIGWYEVGGSDVEVIQLFRYDVLSVYIPFILAVTALCIFVNVLQIISRAWTRKIAVWNLISNTACVALTAAFLFNEKVYNPVCLEIIHIKLSGEAVYLAQVSDVIALSIFIVVVLICFFDALKGFRKIRIKAGN